jgi:hypothetical protein
MSIKIKFFAETGNKTIVFSPVLRIRQGWNEVVEEAIRDAELDLLPFVKMPADWVPTKSKSKIIGRVTAIVPAAQIIDKPVEFQALNEETADQRTVDREKEMQVKLKTDMWTAGRVLAMDLPRATQAIAEQTDIKKLLDLWQAAQSKPPLRKIVKARILKLDPDNPFILKREE